MIVSVKENRNWVANLGHTAPKLFIDMLRLGSLTYCPGSIWTGGSVDCCEEVRAGVRSTNFADRLD